MKPRPRSTTAGGSRRRAVKGEHGGLTPHPCREPRSRLVKNAGWLNKRTLDGSTGSLQGWLSGHRRCPGPHAPKGHGKPRHRRLAFSPGWNNWTPRGERRPTRPKAASALRPSRPACRPGSLPTRTRAIRRKGRGSCYLNGPFPSACVQIWNAGAPRVPEKRESLPGLGKPGAAPHGPPKPPKAVQLEGAHTSDERGLCRQAMRCLACRKDEDLMPNHILVRPSILIHETVHGAHVMLCDQATNYAVA